MDEQKRHNYLHLYKLRCYMSQEVPREDGPLRPHYAFVLEKGKYSIGNKTVRRAPHRAGARPPSRRALSGARTGC